MQTSVDLMVMILILFAKFSWMVTNIPVWQIFPLWNFLYGITYGIPTITANLAGTVVVGHNFSLFVEGNVRNITDGTGMSETVVM